jgi:DNA-binding response OmpR family regulator
MKVPTARILVIDDNLAVVDILATALGEEGYGVLSAVTSDEGLKLFILSQPDLVLLDIALPGMNGIEMLKRIRSIVPTARVVMVSGTADLMLARQALELGALAYVDKPFDLAYLKRVVAMALRPGTEQPDV